MLLHFYAPDDGAGAAPASANDDDLFEAVDDSVAESDQPIDGIKAVNTPDSQGNPLEQDPSDDDDRAEESFDDLIKGRYKDEFQTKVNGIIDKRFKTHKQTEEKAKKLEGDMAKLRPLFSAMAAKYGLDPNDIEGIVKAADQDNSNFESEAYEKGFGDAAAYREHLANQAELNRLREAERVRQESETQDLLRRQLLEGWETESEAFRKEIPDFDFKKEWDGSERFRYLVNSGFKVKEAYMAVHAEEYARAAAERAQQDILREVKANKARPVESNVGTNTAIRVKKSIKDMSLEDTERIIREAKAGKKITF